MTEVWTQNANGSATVTGRELVPLSKKLNPIWGLMNGDSWTAPEINNGEPYLPGVTNQLLRNFFWFCRNPLANFVGNVIGVNDRNYTVIGSPQVLLTSWRDATPRRTGWRWSLIILSPLFLPYVSYYNGRLEAYLGWRPSGGFGLKIVLRND